MPCLLHGILIPLSNERSHFNFLKKINFEVKYEMQTCLRCNWVLNLPFNKGKMNELLDEAMRWLNVQDGEHGERIRRKVFTMIENYKKLKNDSSRKYTICRHCLMESISLLANCKVDEEFNKTFVNVYDFNSVIY